MTLATQALPALETQVAGRLVSPRLIETSGIASSNRDPGLLWGVNDSGHAPLLHAFSGNGSDLGHIQISNSINIDWEDLASFVLDDTPYLLVADTGDNNAGRHTSYLLIVVEPLPNAKGEFSGAIEIVARIPFRYEDGPRDVEAVAVDVASDRVLLVSKRDVPAVVYELPLTLVKGIRRPLTARKIARLTTLPRPTLTEIIEAPLLGPWRHQPTAIDISRDGSVLALLTYQNLYLFSHVAGQLWAESFAVPSQVLQWPELTQTESVAFFGDRVVAVAEGRLAKILSIGPLSN